MPLTIISMRDAKKSRNRTIEGVKYSAANSAYYYKIMRGMLEWMQEEFDRTVIRGLDTKQMIEKVTSFKDESPNERYKKMLALFTKRLRTRYSNAVIDKMVRRALKRSESYSRREMERRLKSFGIDLSKSEMYKRYSSYISTTVQENITLVKNLQEDQAKRLQSVVLRGMREGIAVNRLASEIQKTLGIAKRRATNIARTETHKITQQLADARAMDVGIERGIWRAVMDNRTSDQHARFNGKPFNLKKGLWDPKTKTWNWPGRRPRCRCRTIYIIPGVDDEK